MFVFILMNWLYNMCLFVGIKSHNTYYDKSSKYSTCLQCSKLEIYHMYVDRSEIFDIPKREVESQCINQSSELLPRSKAAHASMWPMQVLISLLNILQIVWSIIKFVCKHWKATALMYSLQGLGVERFVFTLLTWKR